MMLFCRNFFVSKLCKSYFVFTPSKKLNLSDHVNKKKLDLSMAYNNIVSVQFSTIICTHCTVMKWFHY